MIQHRRYPLPVWTGTTWEASTIIVGQDEDRGPGPLGPFAKRTGGIPLAEAARLSYGRASSVDSDSWNGAASSGARAATTSRHARTTSD